MILMHILDAVIFMHMSNADTGTHLLAANIFVGMLDADILMHR